MSDMKQHIRESNLIEGVDNPKEDRRSLWAWNWLIKQEAIVPSVILELHRKIMLKKLCPSERGHYRKVQVWVGRHKPPEAQWVEQLIYDWCMNVNYNSLIEYPKKAHIEFERIHPFIDGNGRTGRMLMWWHELKQGKPPTLILNSQKQDYYKWFTPTKRKD